MYLSPCAEATRLSIQAVNAANASILPIMLSTMALPEMEAEEMSHLSQLDVSMAAMSDTELHASLAVCHFHFVHPDCNLSCQGSCPFPSASQALVKNCELACSTKGAYAVDFVLPQEQKCLCGQGALSNDMHTCRRPERSSLTAWWTT